MTKRSTGLLDLPPSGNPPADTGTRPLGIMGLAEAPADRTTAAIEATAADMFEALEEASRLFCTVERPNTVH